MRTRLYGLILSLVMLAGVGCGGTVPQLPDVPAAVEGAEQGVYDGANKALAVLNAALELVDTISLVEDQEARSGNIPPEADVVFDRAIVAYLDAQDTAREAIVQGVQTWDELRAHLQPVIDRVNDLTLLADQVGVIRSRFKEWIDALARIVMGSLTGSPVYGG